MSRLADTNPPIWREGRVGLEMASLLRDPIWRGEGVKDGRGRPVLLVPGFMAGDNSLSLLTNWLRRAQYYTRRAAMRVNVSCSESAVEGLERRAEELAESQGSRVMIVGQSRGGNLARVLAVRRPDLISGIVGLGSPLTHQVRVHPFVQASVLSVGLLGTVGVPGLFKRECLTGECCERFRADIEAPFPRGVGFVSVYSRSDGIVDWHACLDPAARQVEIESSHCGMSMQADAFRAIADSLERFRAADDRRTRRLKAKRQRGRLARVA